MVINIKQDQVINNINGIYVVDAGAGTGKTYTITKRYINILEKSNAKISDILLLTFTKNAAKNMKEKIMSKLLEKDPNLNVLDANISTFHSFCKTILSDCTTTPSYLGIDYSLNRNYTLSENEILEQMYFKSIYNKFKKYNTKYNTQYTLIQDKSKDVLNVIRKLLSVGIFPTKTSWFLDGEKTIAGNRELFLEQINKLNEQGQGASGKPTQSKLLAKFKSKKKGKLYYDLPEDFEGDKQLVPQLLEVAFDDDTQTWIDFIHDIYFYYLEHCVKENRLTFDLLIMFAFIELYKNKSTRNNYTFEYIMIDEFQDTNSMQFLLTLLLMKTNNLCVVGDWKQGIYGFRNASITNITQFQDKINHYKNILNKDEQRITFDVTTTFQDFDINFRSSQKILDFSNKSLYIKGNDKEEIDSDILDEHIVKLNANFDLNQESKIEFYQTENKNAELEFILYKIQELIKQKVKIKVYDSDNNYKLKNITYKDIAILTRTKTFGLDIQKLGLEKNIPINYEGGIELFNTPESKLLLATLRLLINKDNKLAWITLLDYLNYSLGAKKQIIKDKSYPKELLDFRKILFKYKKNIIYLITKIFNYFKLDNNYTNSIIKTISSIFQNTSLSVETLIYFIEENIGSEQTYTIDINASDNAVTVQTIHGSKGLEYPVVFIANCNTKQFPSTNSDKSILSFNEITGIRSTKLYAEKNSYKAIFDNWKTDITSALDTIDYDEERRLFFVAITRAKQYVYITASNPSIFFKELSKISSIDITKVDQNLLDQMNVNNDTINNMSDDTTNNIINDTTNDNITSKSHSNNPIENNDTPNNSNLDNNTPTNDNISILNNDSKIIIDTNLYTKSKTIYAVHDIMNYTPDPNGKGKQYGEKIHYLAEQLALNKPLNKDDKLKYNIQIDKLKTFLNNSKYLNTNNKPNPKFVEFKPEVFCSLPITINNEYVLIRGIIDLLIIYKDHIEIIDYKTDQSKTINHIEYIKQLSVYYHVVSDYYNLPVTCKIYYIDQDLIETIHPLTIQELSKVIDLKVKNS